MSDKNLFEQASTQLNLLISAQRNMLLVTAFSLTLATFVKNFNYPFIREIIVVLFAYSIAVGIKSILDFNAYIADVRREDLDIDENKLIDRWAQWAPFSYVLLSVIFAFLLIYLNMEFFKFYIPPPRASSIRTE
jgi:hypothetical protein